MDFRWFGLTVVHQLPRAPSKEPLTCLTARLKVPYFIFRLIYQWILRCLLQNVHMLFILLFEQEQAPPNMCLHRPVSEFRLCAFLCRLSVFDVRIKHLDQLDNMGSLISSPLQGKLNPRRLNATHHHHHHHHHHHAVVKWSQCCSQLICSSSTRSDLKRSPGR